jgi:F0F1-type ATP synthase epsilon subunit
MRPSIRGKTRCVSLEEETMKVSIVEPRGVVWQGVSHKVILPAEDGEMCVLDFHQPFLVSLKDGHVRINEEQEKPVTRGVAVMISNELQILLDSA